MHERHSINDFVPYRDLDDVHREAKKIAANQKLPPTVAGAVLIIGTAAWIVHRRQLWKRRTQWN